MSKSKRNEIGLGPSADADRVLDVARSVAEGRNYLWEQTGPADARAYQDGKPTTSKSTMQLVLGVALKGDVLVLSRESSGSTSIALGLGSWGSSNVKGEFTEISRAIGDALGKASLTA